MRIAVIGAGIIGAAVAFRLAQRGVEVILLDGAAPGSGATAASYAWINANEKVPRDYFALSQAALTEYRRLAWSLAPAPWYHLDGNLIWYSDPTTARELAARVERLHDWGYPAEMVPAPTVLDALAPALRGGTADQREPFAWFPEEGWVEPVALTLRLAEAARHAGARVLTGPGREVVAIGLAGDAVSSVTLSGGQTLPVDGVVNAAGAKGPVVAALVGRELPMVSSPGLVVRAALPEGFEADPLSRPIETDLAAIRPDGPGRVLLAIDIETAPELADAPTGPMPLTGPLVDRLLAWAAALIPALSGARPTEALVALRPIPADGYPSVGPVAAIPGYAEAITHSGITLAPLIGRLLAEEVVGYPEHPLLVPFRPERAALSAPISHA